MRGWAGAVRRELRHGTCVFAVSALTLLVTVLLWSKGASWGTRWNDLGMLLRDLTIVIGPVALTLGAWQGGRTARSDVTETLESMPTAALTRASTEIAALALAVFAGVLLGWSTAAASILIVGGWGTSAAAWYVLAMAPTVLAYVTFGYALGRLLRWRVVAPMAGLLGYLLIGLTAYRNDGLNAMVGSGTLGEDTYAVFQRDAVAWSALVLTACALAAWGLSSMQRGPGRGRGALTLGVVGAVVGGACVAPAMAAGAQGEAATDVAVVCTKDSGPKWCVLAANQHSLDVTKDAARRMLKQMEGIRGAQTWAGPTRYNAPLDHTQLPTQSVPIDPWGHVAGGVLWNVDPLYVGALFDPQSYCPERFDFQARRPSPEQEKVLNVFFYAAFPVSDWLSDSDEVYPEERVGARFAAATQMQKSEYASLLLAAARSCDVEAAEAAAAVLPKV